MLQKRLYQLVALALVPVLAIQVIGSIQSYRGKLATVNDDALRYARLISDDINSQMRVVENTMQTLSKVPGLRSDPATCSSYLKDVAKDFPSLSGFSYIDRSGTMRCTSFDVPDNANFTTWPAFQEARENGRFTISTLVTGPVSKKPVIPILLPLHDERGQFDGILGTSLVVQKLNEQFSARNLPPDAIMGVFDRAGTIIARVPYQEDLIGKPIMDANRYMLEAKQAGTVTTVTRDGREKVIGFVPLSEAPYDLIVTFGIDRQKALWPVRAEALRNFGAIALGLLLSLLAAAYFGRKILRDPILGLLSVIERQRAGDTGARVRVTNKDTELGKLGYAFNTMAEEITQKANRLSEALEVQTGLTAELNHRVKNTLANVLSIARQSFQVHRPVVEIETVFIDRIMAIAAAHALLSESNWTGLDLGALAATVLKPHQGMDDSRIRIDGPALHLEPNISIALGMVLHELATNAVKHGALSSRTGQVELTWKIADGMFSLMWRESGGPPVVASERRSFGSRFIKSALLQANGKVNYEFLPEGVVFQVSSPLANWTNQQHVA